MNITPGFKITFLSTRASANIEHQKITMSSAIILFVFLPLVFAATDPTKVCAPDQVTFYSYDILKDITSWISIDYKLKLMAAITGSITVVNDLNNGKSYVTDETGNCQSSDLNPKNPYPQCLSADAVNSADIYIGLGNNRLSATGWRFPFNGGSVRAAFTNAPGEPKFPVLSRYVDDKGAVYASFIVDVTTNITQPELLKIPDPCPPKVTSLVNIDYKNKIMAVVLGNTTVVNDLASGKTYITDENGSCQSSDLTPKDPYPQCLPATAVAWTDVTVGFGSDNLAATVWQFPYGDGVLKAAFTNEPNGPNFPIVSRFGNDKGVVSARFYVDVVANITQPALLKIPDPCPPKVIV